MKDGMKTRSFKDDDYMKRRAFLRSYPLQWGEQEEEEEGECGHQKEAEASPKQASLKRRLAAVFQWGEATVLLLKRLKKKVGFYSESCHPFGFKSRNKLLTV